MPPPTLQLRELLAQLLQQLLGVDRRPRRLQTFLETAHGFREPYLFDRLQQVIECALREGLHSVVIVRRDEHEMRAPADVVRGIDAGESRHVDVEEADLGMTLVEQPHRLPPVPRLGHNLELGPRDPKLAPQRIAQQRFIVGDQRVSRGRSCVCRHLDFHGDAAGGAGRQAQLRCITEDQLQPLAQTS